MEKQELIVSEFSENIRQKDVIKGMIVLDAMRQLSVPTQKMIIQKIAEADPEFSLLLLSEFLAHNEQALVHLPLLKRYLFTAITKDPFVTNWLPPHLAADLLIEMTNKAASEQQIVTFIRAMGELGEDSTVKTLADFLYSGTVELTHVAVDALAQIGTDDAVQALIDRLGSDESLDKRILTSLAKTQNTRAYQILADTLGSKHAGPRNVAKTILVGMGAPALPYLFHNLASEDDDLLVHTLNVIGLIGDASAGKHLRQLLFKSPKNANVRFAAYEALGFMNLQGGSFVLANGLEDEDEHVRTAAAKAIDKNLDDILNSGLRNLLREETPQTMAMVRLLIDSEAENVFRSLLDHPFFLQTSLAYLKGQAHPDVTKKFITLLQSMKRQDLVAQLVREEDSQDAEKTLVWAIDDSRMVLRLYRSMLHTLGVQCEVFEFPEQAIERLTAVQPAMIFTDLNMPKITGIDLTKAIRRSYSAEELPIVMVTTQNENEDHEAAQRSGVSGILQKPFTKDMLQNSMKQFLNL